jgi:hypothetical protein
MTEATKKTESAGTTASKKPAGKVADTTSNKASNKASKNTAKKHCGQTGYEWLSLSDPAP